MEQFPVFRFGDFVLDGSQRRLLRSGVDVYLPPKTFELLLHLLQNRGRVLTKDELLEAVWPLEQAYHDRLWYMTLLAVDPLFDRLRDDPRFTDLVRRMNLSAATTS